MKALPFRCLRAGSQLTQIEHADEIAPLLADGTYLRDGTPSYFAWSVSGDAGTRTGVIAACSIAELIPMVEALGEPDDRAKAAIEGEAGRLGTLGCQDAPVAIAVPEDPVRDLIVGAACAATPVYRFTLEDGTHTLWEIKREDAVEALRALLERTEAVSVADPIRAAATIRASRALRDAAKEAGAYTGREPFNWFMAALFAEDDLADGAPQLPSCLILRELL